MEKSLAVIVFLVSALCFSSALARKNPQDGATFFIVGKIFCDPCHFHVETRLSTPLAGFNLTLECCKEGGALTYKKDGVSDAIGQYSIPVPVHGANQWAQCRVTVFTPSEGQCIKPIPNNAAFINFPKNMTSSISSWSRFVSPFGFMTENVNPECIMISNELDPMMN